MKNILFGIALIVAAILLQLCIPEIIPATLLIGAIGLIFALVGYIFRP